MCACRPDGLSRFVVAGLFTALCSKPYDYVPKFRGACRIKGAEAFRPHQAHTTNRIPHDPWRGRLYGGDRFRGHANKGCHRFQEVGGQVVIEAEHFDNRINNTTAEAGRWVVIPDEATPPAGTPTFTNARGVYISSQPDVAGGGVNHNTGQPPLDNPPHVEYKVNIATPGDYQLWLRWGGYDGSSDSIYASIVELNANVPQWHRFSRNIGGDFSAQGGWQGIGGADKISGGPDADDGPAVWTIPAAGTYTIRLTQREDGSAVDALIFQLDSMTDPADLGPTESDLTEGIVAGAPANKAAIPPATATFDSVVKTGPGATVTYQWQTKAPGATTFTDITGATGASYTTPATTLAMSGTQYRFKATSSGTTVTSSAATLITDSTPPSIAYAFATSATAVRIGFSERLDPTSATTPGNFTFNNGVTASGATLSSDGKIVTLKTTALTAGTPYTLTVNGVKDPAGNALNGGTANFVGPTIFKLAKTIENRFFDSFTANNVSALKADPRYPNSPTSIRFEPMFEYPADGGGEGGSNYGNRMSGWITAPESGDYVFFTNSDDPSELWLSTDSDPANKKLIAVEPTWSNARQWITGNGRDATHPQNRSDQYQGTQWATKNVDGGATITLQQNQTYYIEVLHTEGGGGDNVGVNWRLPSALGVDPIDGDPPISADLVDQLYAINGAVTITSQPPQTVNAAANSSATFNVAATSADGSSLIYLWQKAAANSTDFQNTGTLGPSLTTPLLTTADNGSQYRALVISPNGAAITQVATLNVTVDNQPPQVAYFNGMRRYAQIVFNEPIDTATAEALTSYSISAGSITKATASTLPDGRGMVTLEMSGLTDLQSYTLTIKNVKDTANNTIVETTRTFTAYDIVSDFNGGVPPPLSTLSGSAKVLAAGGSDGSGVLELTTNLGNLMGTIGIDDVLAGETVDEASKVTARFKLYIGNGSGNAADGFSFNIASDIDAATVNTGEDGTGGGLTITLDTYDNTPATPEGPSVEVKWAGQVVTMPDGNPASTLVPKATLVNGQWVDVFIQYVADTTTGNGKVTVIHNNVKYFDNLEIPGGTPIATPKIAIGARTGGELERHWVDNLNVVYNVDVVPPTPPTISITAPTNNQELPAGTATTITVNTSASAGVSKVEFYANGTLLGQSTTAPYSFTVPGPAVTPGLYSITAKITDNAGVAVTSLPVNVTVRPVGAPKALLIHATAGPNAADINVVNHLFALGFDTYTVGAANSVETDADGKKLIVVSSSVTSGEVNTKFRGAAVPVLWWEASNLDDFGIEANNVNGTTVGAQTAINIVNAAHPLAAGLPAGLVTVYSAPDTVSTFTAPPAVVPSAVVVANTADNATPVIVAVEKDAALNTAAAPATAPERRAFFFLQDVGFNVLTADGLKLFDAAVAWLTNGGTPPPPATLTASVANNTITITWTNGGTLEWTSALVPGATWTSTSDSDGSYTESVTGAQTKFFRVRNP